MNMCGLFGEEERAFKSQHPGEEERIVNGIPDAKALGVHGVGAWCQR